MHRLKKGRFSQSILVHVRDPVHTPSAEHVNVADAVLYPASHETVHVLPTDVLVHTVYVADTRPGDDGHTHTAIVHDCVWVSDGHAAPPFDADIVTVAVCVWTPGPHVSEHALHALHDTLQLI